MNSKVILTFLNHITYLRKQKKNLNSNKKRIRKARKLTKQKFLMSALVSTWSKVSSVSFCACFSVSSQTSAAALGRFVSRDVQTWDKPGNLCFTSELTEFDWFNSVHVHPISNHLTLALILTLTVDPDPKFDPNPNKRPTDQWTDKASCSCISQLKTQNSIWILPKTMTYS